MRTLIRRVVVNQNLNFKSNMKKLLPLSLLSESISAYESSTFIAFLFIMF